MHRVGPGGFVPEQDPDGVVGFCHDDRPENTEVLIALVSWNFGCKSAVSVLVVASFLVDCAHKWPVRSCEGKGRAVKKEREKMCAERQLSHGLAPIRGY